VAPIDGGDEEFVLFSEGKRHDALDEKTAEADVEQLSRHAQRGDHRARRLLEVDAYALTTVGRFHQPG